MTLRDKQNQFIFDLGTFDDWSDKFNYLISLSEQLPKEFPEYLRKYKIEFCSSNTCLKACMHNDLLYLCGWSNSPVMGGIIVAMTSIFNFTNEEELRDTKIDFHVKTGLIDNLTQIRRAAIEEMINRITTLVV